MTFAQIEEDEALQDSIPDPKAGKIFEVNFFQALSERGIENYGKAIDILTNIEKEVKDEPVVYFQLGLNYFDLEQYDSALQNLKKAESFKPLDLDIKEAIFKVHEEQKSYTEAIDYAQNLAKDIPEYHEILANLYLINKRYQKAIESLDKADQAQGYAINKDKLRAVIYEASNTYDLAIKYYNKRQDLEPYNPMHAYRLVHFLMLNKDYEKALETSQSALQDHPRFTRYHVLQTKIYLDINQPDQALVDLKEVVTDQFLEEVYKIEAIDSFKTYVEGHPEAQDAFIQLLNLASEKAEDSASYLDLGLYYFETDKPKALTNFKKALEQNPQDYEILKRISVLQYQLGEYKEALQTTENALDIFPTQVVFMLVKGQVLIGQTQYNMAKSVLIEAQSYIFEENETMLSLYESLSQVYVGLGEPDKAQNFKTKANILKSKLN
jgi:tetratricopeptide (TPR) repeat protein